MRETSRRLTNSSELQMIQFDAILQKDELEITFHNTGGTCQTQSPKQMKTTNHISSNLQKMW